MIKDIVVSILVILSVVGSSFYVSSRLDRIVENNAQQQVLGAIPGRTIPFSPELSTGCMAMTMLNTTTVLYVYASSTRAGFIASTTELKGSIPAICKT